MCGFNITNCELSTTHRLQHYGKRLSAVAKAQAGEHTTRFSHNVDCGVGI